jgi:mannose-1-phosphate guanylyltransferase/mannose-6-phosphate isomerase
MRRLFIGAADSIRAASAIELEIIEVQSGSYLGEADVVWFDDDFGRR